MKPTDAERFKVGRRFASPVQNYGWKINDVDLDNGVLHVTDDFGYAIKVFIDQFDDNFYFLDDLPKVEKPVGLGCDHDYTEYQGLRECFMYCTKCNKKKE